MMCQCECEKPGNPVSFFFVFNKKNGQINTAIDCSSNLPLTVINERIYVQFRDILKTLRIVPDMELTCVEFVNVHPTFLAENANVTPKILASTGT